MNRRVFHYYPTDIKNAYTGKSVKGFKYPSIKAEADLENLQQIQIYFGVHEVISSLEDLKRVSSDKLKKLYTQLTNQLIEDYNTQCVAALTLASRMCWVPVNPANPNEGYIHKLTPDQAIYHLEPGVKGMMLAVQTAMDLTFPAHLVKNVARLEIEKELIDLEETTGAIKKSLKR